MGNNCAPPSERKSVAPLSDGGGPSPDTILGMLSSTEPLRTTELRSLLKMKRTPTNSMLCEACKNGHWEVLVFFHLRHGVDPHSSTKYRGKTALEWSSAQQDNSVAPAKKIMRRQREKVRQYLQLCPSSFVVSASEHKDIEEDQEARDDRLATLVLKAAFRFGDKAWLERTLDATSVKSISVFRLLVEAIHAGDTLLVTDLFRRGCLLEVQVEARDKATGFECWETAIHHSVTSLSLRSRGVQTAVIQQLLDLHNCGNDADEDSRLRINRRNAYGHTALSLAVNEGNLEVVRILLSDYRVDTDFDIPVSDDQKKIRTVSFKEWATTSSLRINTMAENPDAVSLAMRSILAESEDKAQSDDDIVRSSPGRDVTEGLDRGEIEEELVLSEGKSSEVEEGSIAETKYIFEG